MFQTTFDRGGKIKSIAVLFGRLLLAMIFLHEAVSLILHFDAASAAMQKLGVPPPLLVATIGLQLAAGLSIAGGVYPQVGATALGLFCLATALIFHRNFASQNEILHFEKDLAIAGGMFILAANGAGSFSVGQLLRRRLGSDDGAEGGNYSIMSGEP